MLMYSHHTHSEKIKELFMALSYGFFASLVAYCCISVVAGRAGILAYQDLLVQKVEIQRALDFLQQQNSTKQDIIDDLKNNSVKAAEQAAALGYVRKGQTLIVLPETWRNSMGNSSEGMKLPRVVNDSTGLPDSLIRLMSAITGIIVFLSIQLFHFKSFALTSEALNLKKAT